MATMLFSQFRAYLGNCTRVHTAHAESEVLAVPAKIVGVEQDKVILVPGELLKQLW